MYFFFSQEEQEASLTKQPLIESVKTEPEPLTVIEQPEITASQPAANQAMKGNTQRTTFSFNIFPFPNLFFF